MSNEKNTPSTKKEGNAYDKIFKENAVAIFRPLIEETLGVRIVKFLPEEMDFQKTMERKADFLYKVETSENKSFLLHLEFQIKDYKGMLHRMMEYHGMIQSKKKMPMEHVVIYLGSRPPKMRTKLRSNEIFKGFHLLDVQSLDPEVLLASQVPEVIITAILCDFPKNKVESILRLLWKRLKATTNNKHDLEKYLHQLIILSRIRKFEDKTIKILNDMTLNIDIETSVLYQRGYKKAKAEAAGKEAAKIKAVKAEAAKEATKEAAKEAAKSLDNTIKSLLLLAVLTDKQIAESLSTSLYRVRKIKKLIN